MLRNCGHISDISLTAIAASLLPSLRTLDVSGCRRISDHGLLQFARKCGPASENGSKLAKLGMSGCWRLTRLGYLQILNTLFTSDSRISSFESSLPLHPLLTADQVFSNLPVGFFTGLTSLTLKDTERCVNDAVLASIVKSCGSSLKTFHLQGATLVTEPGFLKVVDDLGKVEKLHLPGARRLGDASLVSIVQSRSLGRNLLELDVSGWNTSDVGLVQAFESSAIVDPLPHLQALVMADCIDNNFSFHGVFAVLRGLLGTKPKPEQRLKLFDISGCPDLDNADGHMHFVGGMPQQAPDAGVPVAMVPVVNLVPPQDQPIIIDEATMQQMAEEIVNQVMEEMQEPEEEAFPDFEAFGSGGLEADPTPVSDDFVVSLLQVPDKPLGSQKIGGRDRWYCVLKAEVMERAVEEAMRRKQERAPRTPTTEEEMTLPDIANAAAG